VSIAVIHNFRVAWVRSYGVADVASGQPVEATTLFQVASISKPVTAMAATWLAQERRLRLDDDINAVLRSWRLPLSNLTGQQPVTPHDAQGRRLGAPWHVYPEQAPGLWTTPTDLARFVIEVQTALRGPRGRVLSQASARQMVAPVGTGPFAVGLSINKRGEAGISPSLAATGGFAPPTTSLELLLKRLPNCRQEGPRHCTNANHLVPSCPSAGLPWIAFPLAMLSSQLCAGGPMGLLTPPHPSNSSHLRASRASRS
jgi:CubicO group peptidase (beta-lactamase class C family)